MKSLADTPVCRCNDSKERLSTVKRQSRVSQLIHFFSMWHIAKGSLMTVDVLLQLVTVWLSLKTFDLVTAMRINTKYSGYHSCESLEEISSNLAPALTLTWFWWSKVKGHAHCDLAKQDFGHNSSCECDFSGTPRENFISFGTNIHLKEEQSRFCSVVAGQRSNSLRPHISPIHVNAINRECQKGTSWNLAQAFP